MTDNRVIGEFLSAVEPTEAEKSKLAVYFESKLGCPVDFVWVEDASLKKGFILRLGGEVYDNTPEGLVRGLKAKIDEIDKSSDDYVSLIRESVENWRPRVLPEEVGLVRSVADGIARVTGLHGVKYGEILTFECGAKGLALDLDEDETGCVLFDDEDVVAGENVYRTGKTAGVPVSEEIIGRVVSALGEPVDGLGAFAADKYMPVESPAPAIIDRSPVNEPLKTGILTIDSMFPIGKGQRELIIGDRQTGKTSVAVDVILNQKGKNVLCVYCAIGQKAQSFSFDAVAAGTYDLVVTKLGHLTYTITGVKVESGNVDLAADTSKVYSTITLLAGDVDQDGNINESDVSVIRYASNINKPVSSAANPLADVDGDGNVNESDVSIVRYAVHINKNTGHCTFVYAG